MAKSKWSVSILIREQTVTNSEPVLLATDRYTTFVPLSEDRKMKNDYFRSVSMQCSTCGSTDFEFEDSDDLARCTGCDRSFDRQELIRENGERIDSHVDEMKSAIISDARKDLRKMFKKFR